MKKKILIIISFCIILVLLITLFFAKGKEKIDKNIEENVPSQIDLVKTIDMDNLENAEIEDNKKINTSSKIAEEKTYGNIIINNIKLYATSDLSYFVADVTSDKDQSGQVKTISFVDKDNNIISEIEVYIPDLKANVVNKINASTTKDIANAYDFVIK